MVHRILTWCGGIVLVCLPGREADRFINICRAKGIIWWGVRWDAEKKLVYGYLRRCDYFRLRSVVQKTGIFPVVKKRIGGYFLIRRGLKRSSFWCGIAVLLFLLFFLAGRIWGIEISGESQHSRESILRYLETKDIYGGMSGKKVVCSRIEAEIRKKYLDIGWVSVEKSGSKLYIRMDEMIMQQEKVKKEPGDLVAESKGRVLGIVTKEGTAKVRAGDDVKKGQTLIKGKLKIMGDNDEVVAKKRVRADGIVVLQCVENYRDSMPVKYKKRDYTGRKRDIYKLQCGSRNLFVYNPLKSLESYEKYDIIREGGRLCPFLSLRFPVCLWKKTFREIHEKKTEYSHKEAEEILQKRYIYYCQQMKEKECFDIAGKLSVTKKGESFVGETEIVYSKKQTKYK